LVRNRLAAIPGVYLPIATRKYSDSVPAADTELMIDGFTRSAIVFSSIAFQIAQPRPVRLAHTIHAPGLIKLAAERRLPVVLALRDPRDVAMSAAVRQPYLSLNDILRAYAQFYEPLLPNVANVVIGRFQDLSTDLGSVIRTVNERYGTTFEPFKHTDENVHEAFEIAEDRARAVPWLKEIGWLQSGRIGIEQYRAIPKERAGSRAIPEHRVPRPSDLREAGKDRMRAQLEEPALRPALRRALSIYAVVGGEAPEGPSHGDPGSGSST
jgi:hypothetical protein